MNGLEVERDGAVVRLTIDRPSAANTVDVALAERLRDTVRGLDDGVRVIVLAATGSVFCGGGDMREVLAAADPSTQIELLARHLYEALLAIDACHAVTIAEVGGAVAGGGLGLVLHADLVIASDRARFLTAYDRIAVTPDSGVSDLLPRTIGLHRALQLTMLGRELDAETAASWGLVAEVVPHDELAERVDAIAARLAAGSTAHLKRTARLYRVFEPDHAQRLDAEAAAIGWASAQPEARERLQRFARTRTERPEA